MTDDALTARVGELVMAGFEGTAIADVPVDLVQRLGGFILFRRNLDSVDQIRRLTDGIRSAAAVTPAPLIAIDQEGGPVSRLRGIGTSTPSAMALGAAADLGLTEQMYALAGSELSALGINVDFAPVADVNANPENPVIGLRSFGDDPAAVSGHVVAAVRGLQRSGVAATAKHFPGHGDTSVDSHLELPVIRHDAGRVRAVELAPFRAAIGAGVDAIMTAHIAFPAIATDETPVTLSRAILTGLLREELGFEGVICTDCMEMQAIAAAHSPADAAVMAIKAGADLVLFSHTPDKVRVALAALERALTDGELDADQIRRSLERVTALRRRRNPPAPDDSQRQAALATVGSAAHREKALAAARRAITLIRDPSSLLPLQIAAGERVLCVQFEGEQLTPVEDRLAGGKQRTVLGAALAMAGARVHEQTRSLDPSGHEYKQLLMASGSAEIVIALTTRLGAHPLQARAVSDLMMLGKRVVAVATREPYDAALLPPQMTVVATFGEDPHAMQALSEALTGALKPTGLLPVRLPDAAAGALP